MSYAIYPIPNWEAVTPSDTLKLSFQGKSARSHAIVVGVDGNVAVRNQDGSSAVIKGLVAGGQYSIQTDQILATGTSASDITAGFGADVTS